MPLVFLPDSPAFPYSPYSHPYHQRQQQQPTFVGYPQQQHFHQPSSFSPFDIADQLDIAPSSLFSPSPPRHVHHPQHQPSPASHYHPHQSLPFDPIEAQKQRLLAEFAQSLDKLYPSSSSSASRASTQSRTAAPSYDSERIRYLEAQIREERLREELEQEQLRLEEERERQEEEQRRRVAEQKRQQQLVQARLLQQQQRQQEEEKAARRRVEAQQQQQQQRRLPSPAPRPAIGGLEQLLSLLGVTEDSPRQEIQQPQQVPAQQTPSSSGIDKLLSLAQALEDRPVPRAGEPPVASEKLSRPSTPPTTSSPKPLPPSPLTILRSLRSRFQTHLASSSTTPSNILSHHLEKLLIEADALESGGDQLVRSERKKFVRDVERVLEGLEEKPSAPAEEEFKPAQAVEGSAPAKEVSPASATDSPAPLATQDASNPAVAFSPSLDTPTVTNTTIADVLAPLEPSSEPTAASFPPLNAASPDSSSDSFSTSITAKQASASIPTSSSTESAPIQSKRKGRPASVEDWDEEGEKAGDEVVVA